MTTQTTLVPADTAACFTVRALFGRPVTGRIPVTRATVEVDAAGCPTTVTADLELAGIDTGNPRRDRDLRKPSLLDLENVTTLTFRSTEVAKADTGWCVTGDLTRDEHTTPVTLTVTRRGDEFVAEGNVDRRTLGVRAPRFMIGHELALRITTPAW